MPLLKKTSGSSDRQIAVLAYGSLLAHPGDWLGSAMQKLVRWETPFSVEYVGRSQRRGGAPALVRSDGHNPVNGGLIVLGMTDTAEQVAQVSRQLADREGAADTSAIKSDRRILGFRVIYSDFGARFTNPTPEELARAAIDSVAGCFQRGHPFMNGIRYLRENLEWGVVTDLSFAYRDAILNATQTTTLDQAEYEVLKLAMPSVQT
jgi:hypothetical protein